MSASYQRANQLRYAYQISASDDDPACGINEPDPAMQITSDDDRETKTTTAIVKQSSAKSSDRKLIMGKPRDIQEDCQNADFPCIETNCARKKQHQLTKTSPSFLILLIAAILINLCPFDEQELAKFNSNNKNVSQDLGMQDAKNRLDSARLYSNWRLIMFGEAKILMKMAKMIYIKKKIKKLNKKLKKHTIAVPVITAIPIYEHSYYPPPHVTHMTHHGGGQGGGYLPAASYYSPTYAHASSTSSGRAESSPGGDSSVASSSGNQSSYQPESDAAASASQHQQRDSAAVAAYHSAVASRNQDYQHQQQQQHQQMAAGYATSSRYSPYYAHSAPPTYSLTTTSYQQQQPSHYHAGSHLYSSHPYGSQYHAGGSGAYSGAATQQIINAYPPSPPVFYGDDSGGMYGHYGNAYGRYDGGYHLW